MSHRLSRRILAVLLLASAAPAVAAPERLIRKLEEARLAYEELMEVPDRAAPRALQEQARCVAVIPRILKGAFVAGGRHGRGVLTCRDAEGRWSAPVFVRLSGGSVGFQAGFEASDLVLFFVNERGIRSLLETKLTLGLDASVAAGPAGRAAEAATDLALRAEVYAYAKARGLFAGIAIQGARLAVDRRATRAYYGGGVSPVGILFQAERPDLPDEAQAFLDALP